jgi:hypothetical protein
MSERVDIDLGDGHTLQFTSWRPDRALNPQYQDLPDVERIGAIVRHRRPNGDVCESGIMFDCEATRRGFPDRPRWVVQSWEPLTLAPSLLCDPAKGGCGDHGWIKQGRWQRA